MSSLFSRQSKNLNNINKIRQEKTQIMLDETFYFKKRQEQITKELNKIRIKKYNISSF